MGAFALVVVFSACAEPAVKTRVAAPGSVPAVSTQSPIASPTESARPVSAPPAPSAAPKPLAVRIDREIEANVVALAVEKQPHVLALGKDLLWVHDDSGWRSRPLPKGVVVQNDAAFSLFFGRDYRARIVGVSGGRRIYLREKEKGLESDRKEIGKLGADDKPVVAVLGTADPEIVCRPNDTCLLKSVRGWKSIPDPAGIERVALGNATAWALAGHRVFQLTDKWEPRDPEGSWAHADALVGTHDGLCVIDTAASRLHFFDGASWRIVDSVITHPHAMWSPDGHSFVVVGDGGLAKLEGSDWQVAADAPHPLLAIAGRPGGAVYVGGPSGIFSVVLTGSSQ